MASTDGAPKHRAAPMAGEAADLVPAGAGAKVD
jgi:hypothetical protein